MGYLSHCCPFSNRLLQFQSALVHINNNWLSDYRMPLAISPRHKFHRNYWSIFGFGPISFSKSGMCFREIRRFAFIKNLNHFLPRIWFGMGFNVWHSRLDVKPVTLCSNLVLSIRTYHVWDQRVNGTLGNIVLITN